MLVYTITKGNNKSFVYDIYHGIQGEKGDQGIQGEQGIQGVPGTAATIQVGNVTSGATPSVTNVGTSNAAIFDFVLEKGEKGDQGDKGQAAGFGTPTASATALPVGSDPTVSVTASGDPTQKVFAFSFGIPSGGDDNVQADWDQTNTSADDYIKNKPTIPVVATAIAAGDTGYTTGDQVYTALQNFESDVWTYEKLYIEPSGARLKLYITIKKNNSAYTSSLYLKGNCQYRGASSSIGETITKTLNYSSSNQTHECQLMTPSNGHTAYSISGTIYTDSQYQNPVLSFEIGYPRVADSISNGENGLVTGNQVYQEIGNINTILQSI